jgi:replicative DNA helicase
MYSGATIQPPSNVQAEMALLGAILANNRGLDRCPGLLPEHFAGEGLGDLFAAIRVGVNNGQTVDAVSLRWTFEPALLASVLAACVGHNVVPDYARVIRETAQARALIGVADELAGGAYGAQPPPDIATQAIRQIDRIMAGNVEDRLLTLNEAMDQAIADMSRDEPGGVATGFRCIDKRIGRLEAGLVYVIAGRPSMGKSALGHKICINAAQSGVGVLEVSLEMSAKQLGRRALAVASGVPMSAMRPGLQVSTADNLMRARTGPLADLPIYIDESAGQTPSMIAAKAREVRRRHGIGLLMIDHLNLMRPEAEDAKHGGTWAVGRASNTVLQIAKDCQCPVILCVQLNRGPESREDHRPNLADLRQSGDIEQDAFAVGFVYRPEVYLQSDPERREGESAEHFERRCTTHLDLKDRSHGKADLIWGKVRDGAIGTDRLNFHAPTACFSEEFEP